MRLKHVVALALAGALMLPSPILAQAAGAAAQKLVAQPQAGNLKIVVLEGEGAKNNLRAKSGTAPVVEVRDEADKPVPGAEVVFQLPATGPGAVFHGWMRTQTVRSDAQGKAAVTGYTPNDEEGRFNIKVTATSGAKTGSAVIAQSNVRGSGDSAGGARRKWWKPVAVIAGVAIVGGVVAGTRGGSSTTTTTTAVTITPGAVSVGGPR